MSAAPHRVPWAPAPPGAGDTSTGAGYDLAHPTLGQPEAGEKVLVGSLVCLRRAGAVYGGADPVERVRLMGHLLRLRRTLRRDPSWGQLRTSLEGATRREMGQWLHFRSASGPWIQRAPRLRTDLISWQECDAVTILTPRGLPARPPATLPSGA